VVDDVEGDALGEVGGDGESDPDVAGLPGAVRAGAGDRHVDADDLGVLVEEGAAGVAGVDGGIRLDDREVDVRLLQGGGELLLGALVALAVATLAGELPEVERAFAAVASVVVR